MSINFYDRDIIINGQEVFGEVHGYIAKECSSFCWVETAVYIDVRKKKNGEIVCCFIEK